MKVTEGKSLGKNIERRYSVIVQYSRTSGFINKVVIFKPKFKLKKDQKSSRNVVTRTEKKTKDILKGYTMRAEALDGMSKFILKECAE